ncbi:MAG TPA: CDP-glycerol glycerophosphotransferase family protein [Micromonosporaceae bacterium]|nr:CDP-glycerol glycerophosphotransferase family protein [Micromonosporaceae bacterium]
MRGDLVKKLTMRCLTAGLALLAFVILVLTGAEGWGLGFAVAATAAAWVERRVNPKAELVAEPILLAASILGTYAGQFPDGISWPLVITGVALLGLILIERPLSQAAALETQVANLAVRSWPTRVAARLSAATLVLLASLAVCAAFAVPVWPAMVATLLLGLAAASTAGVVALRRLRPSAARSAVARALRRHEPEFLLYFSAPPGSEYQVLMWLPYLERIGRPFFVLLREPGFLPVISAATSAPVVYCPTLRSLDEAIVPSARVAFYVNHGAQNSHCVRFRQLTHIQLHHGDSDKSPSANPASAIYDKIFVAGQAAIDRYARAGVAIPRDKFAIVGRPQVESIVGPRDDIGELSDPVVLYTPTWTGHHADANYCSLPMGAALVERLLARRVTVIMRAHPYTSQNPESARQLARIEELLSADRARTGRAHVWGSRAAKKMTLVECINRSDVLISDVSGVISDYLFSGKPYAVTDMVNEGEEFVSGFPLARGGYVLRPDLSNVDDVLELLLNADPLAETRRALRTRYLGDFPAQNYAEAFLAEARRYLGSPVDAAAPAPRTPSDAADAVTSP